ncbi:MAG: GatB/YqeY domain-containing protein [Pseudomonadales bacterium]|jgi:uncharacterized protein YqeY|nr:GatB/YqeY domain-containing protein [Pseudomonadales bacterium]
MSDMTIKQQLMEDMKTAMRAGDAVARDTIRFLMSEIKNVELDNGEQDDQGVQKIVASQVKKIKEGIEEFKKAGRDDLIVDEETKVTVLENYLPKQLSDAELEEAVKKVLAENADNTNKGQVIGLAMKAVDGQADGGRVSAMVNKLLS